MARVLLAANSTWNFENFRIGLIRELVRRGHQVTTVSPDPHGVHLDDVPVRHRQWKMDRASRNPLKELAGISSLARIIVQERPDVVLGFTIKPNLYGSAVCRLLKIPAVPNVTGLGTAFLGGSALRRAVSLMYRFAFRGAKAVFFQNRDDQALFVREGLVRMAQSQVLPGSGINLVSFSPSELPTEMRFLMIARLLGDKGVREYVRAARKIKEKVPSATFWLLGEFDPHNATAIQRQEVDAWIKGGVIEYLGSSADVRPFIRRSTAVVLPSYREGLSRTLLEAAAMARPLIGTDVPGCREVVREGVTGFLCRPRSADSLAAAMLRFAATTHEERCEMGAQARIMTEREFDEAIVFGRYLEVVEALSR